MQRIPENKGYQPPEDKGAPPTVVKDPRTGFRFIEPRAKKGELPTEGNVPQPPREPDCDG
jgi:hypothetical protein